MLLMTSEKYITKDLIVGDKGSSWSSTMGTRDLAESEIDRCLFQW